jgi:hypothetical protein
MYAHHARLTTTDQWRSDMATKHDTATNKANEVGELAQAHWEQTYETERAHRQMSAQFFAISEQLGWRGPASDPARTGQQTADAFAAKCGERCNRIRDFIEDAERSSKGAKR